MSKTILAFDLASKISGYAVFIDGKLETYGKFIFDDIDIDIRLVKIRNKIIELIRLYNPTEVVYEDIQLQENVLTFKTLAEVYGVLSEVLEELHIKHSSVLASSWKSSLGIKGRNRPELKRNAQLYVVDHYGVKPTQDECDAICIGLFKVTQSTNDWSEQINSIIKPF